MNDVRRIVVRCPNWLGDVVMSTPGLCALRARYPDAWIVAHAPITLVPLLAGNAHVDEVWPVHSRGGGGKGWWRDVAMLRAGGFDLGLAIPESISSALLMRLGGVTRVVGFGRDRVRRALLHEVVPAPAGWGRRRLVSKERFVLRLMAAATSSDERVTPLELAVTPAEKEEFVLALERAGMSHADYQLSPPVVIAPGAGFGESKCWPPESFASLGDRIAALGLPVVLLGAPGESHRLARVVDQMESRPIVLDGVLSVGGLKSLLRGARVLVANDAGARHVAAAFGVPSVVFFGPTSVAKTADHLAQIQVLESDHDCRPCYRRICPIDHRCLTTIDVDTAEAATVRALEEAPSQHGVHE